MDKIHALIGEHLIQMTSNNIEFATSIFNENECLIPHNELQLPHLIIHVEKGYGVPFVDYHIKITKEKKKTYFQRADYLIETDDEYKVATLYVYDQLALKHALTNLYSSYIVYHNWGLLIHSSCAIEDERAHIFAGQSGAGKSTAAKLSHPRMLLSDEATLVKITPNEITVFDSPFRSEIKSTGLIKSSSLASVQLLHQSLENNRVPMNKSDSFLKLMNKIFYWAHDPSETKKIVGLLEILIKEVPIYNLYFQKNNTFWELIS